MRYVYVPRKQREALALASSFPRTRLLAHGRAVCGQGVLKDAGLAKEAVDEVVLVGGSTRIPMIRSMLSSFFGGP